MKVYDKIIFVDENGTCRAPMAAEIFRDIGRDSKIEACARGLVVQFPEPVNQKAKAVMVRNGLNIEDYMTKPFVPEDVDANTLILTMESRQRQKILDTYQQIERRQVRVLTEQVGDELEIVNPYGGSLQVYGLCYETLLASVRKLVDLLTRIQK